MASSGNFCTWSPLLGIKDDGSKGITLSEGDLKATHSHNGIATLGTQAVKSGKWYWEVHYSASSNFNDGHLICGWQSLKKNVDFAYIRQQPGSGAGAPDRYNWGSHLMNYRGTGTNAYQGGYISSYNDVNNDTYDGAYNLGLRVGTASVLQYAGDFDNNKLYFGVNNTWYSLANSGTGTDGANTASGTFDATYGFPIESTWQGYHWIPAIWFSGASSGSVGIGNWGQDSSFAGTKSTGTAAAADGNGFGDFYYSPPSGYLSLCSANIPISSDIDPAETDDNISSKQVGAVAYSGTQTADTAITVGFKPDLIWTKIREASDSRLVDSSRGSTKYLISNTTGAEGTSTTGVTSFTSTGYVLGADQLYNGVSGGTPYTYVAWCWRANGGTTATNTDGTITSTVQANQAAGFSIMQWAGDNSQNATIGHGLGGIPDMWIVKDRDATGNWRVGLNTTAGAAFHSLNGDHSALKLNLAEAAGDLWRTEGNFTATATTCNTPNNGNSAAFFTTNGNNFIGYCWRSILGFSKFGTFEGNGNADGPFVFTGFKPRILFVKDIDRSENWVTFDLARDTFNTLERGLFWNANSAESTGSGSGFDIDALANGFKLRCSHDNLNGTSTYAYGAWGDVPFKYNNTHP